MRLALPLAALFPLSAQADAPNVVTDIAPIHSLVAQVMDGIASPDVLVSGGASPHDFQFTFTQANAVQNADLVIWMGGTLTPWLEEALDTLASDAPQLILLETQTWDKAELRDWDDGHDHGDHAEDDHDDHGDDEHEGHDDHADDGHEEPGHDDHDDHAVDPHAWLDPMVAIVWVDDIATALIAADSDNADAYSANAVATIERLQRLDQDIADQMQDLPRGPYLVPHDAYQYFERRYDLPAAGAISLSDAASPSPTKIAELQDTVAQLGVTCVLSDPQSRDAWVNLVREGSDASTAMADPIGSTLEIGPDHYQNTLLAISEAYADCLGG